MLRDMMPAFELYQPDTLPAALDLADALGPDGWLVGGGANRSRAHATIAGRGTTSYTQARFCSSA